MRIECALVFEQVDSAVGGSMVERQTFGDDLYPGLPSDVAGNLQGNSLLFEKYYVHKDDDADPVVYELQISPDGNTMTGFWSIGDVNGTAMFRRVTGESVDRIPAPR